MSKPNQFALLVQRRFGPFFWVQFLGAGNDNLFKFAFTLLVTYQLQMSWLPPALAGLVIGALFILPFVLFSATSGQLADKLEKTVLIRGVKWLEIAIMAFAGWGFISASVPALLACVFLMGLHSTIFGPVKFAYLPQHLSERELTGGNGMVEMGTFVAILLGQVAGGLLIAVPGSGPRLVALACVGVAVLGRVVAQWVPLSPATDPGLKINWNPFSETWRNLLVAYQSPAVFRSLLGISWMWFFGAVFLSMFPAFAHDVLHGDEQVASLLLVVFSVGIGIGALLCEVLSHRHVEIGLVPLGAIGMSVFAIDLYFAARSLPPGPALELAVFLARPAHWHVMADLGAAGAFGRHLQRADVRVDPAAQPGEPPGAHHRRQQHPQRAVHDRQRPRRGLVAEGGSEHPRGVPAGRSAQRRGRASTSSCIVPEYLLRFVAFVLARCMYRLQLRGDEHIPDQRRGDPGLQPRELSSTPCC